MESLKQIWESGWLTNMGTFHNRLEEELTNYLGVKYLSLFCNGTIALMTALKALDIKGEVITTPYSFVATAHAIVWNDLTPVFVDVLPENGNMDPDKIEEAITANTSAIMPVHVYGNPCEVDKIQEIADKQKLKIIYDAAHAFGVKKDGISILNYGDLSVLSFHATKVFNTIEGGAIICHTISMKRKIDQLRNFGYDINDQINRIGINGKLNEFQSAIGLLNLNRIDALIGRRKEIFEYYNINLKNIKGIHGIDINSSVDHNYSYYPIFIDEEFPFSRDQLYDRYTSKGIFPRKYFFPLISNFNIYSKYASSQKENLVNANRLANQVLCLPIYPQLTNEEIEEVISIIKGK